MVLEKTLESPLDCKEIQPVHSKGDQPWDFFGRNALKLKLQSFGHLMRRVDSLEKTLRLGVLGWKDPLEKGMATHSSIPIWKIPWAEELECCNSWGPKESDMTERPN